MNLNLVANTIYLRLVKENDAEFICQLRGDVRLNQFISPSSSDVEHQKQWIQRYQDRELKNEEFYFIIHRNDNGTPIGTVRMYDFLSNPKSFCWGSWILNENKTKYAAVESALLVYEFGFNTLNFDQSHFDVMKGNQKVHDFHIRMGAIKVSEDELNNYYIFSKDKFQSIQDQYKSFLLK